MSAVVNRDSMSIEGIYPINMLGFRGLSFLVVLLELYHDLVEGREKWAGLRGKKPDSTKGWLITFRLQGKSR